MRQVALTVWKRNTIPEKEVPMERRSLVWIAVLVVVMVSFSLAHAGQMVIPRPDVRDRVPGEIIVGFRPDATSAQIQEALASIGAQVTGQNNLPQTKIRRVKISSTSPEDLDGAISRLKAHPAVKYAEPNRIKWAHGTRVPLGGAGVQSLSSDPLLYDQWGYFDMSANWLNAPATTAPMVAVIDTGVDYTHPDLAGNVVKGYDFVNGDNDPMDDHGHGTHVSGVIAAKTNNAYGIAGISWNSKILAIKALSSQGWGSDWDIHLAIKYAANNTAVKVINMSLGGAGPPSSFEYDAVEYAVVTKKKLLVASAGNNGIDTPSFPAGFADPVEYPEFEGMVMAVAAHGDDHCKASFSNYGSWVSITAPGVDILSTVPPSLGYTGFDSWNGTSMAAPHVAGAAAVAWAKFPTYRNWQIFDLLTTKDSSLYDPLDRDGSCWPLGDTFERLDILHIIESDFYESTTNKGAIYGFALDAETGEPLAGAKVVTKLGSSQAGTDFVSYYGYLTFFDTDEAIYGGYGLFNVLTDISTPSFDNSLIIKKKKYAPMKILDIPVSAGSWTYAGNIPVPPNRGKYWLAVTWDYGYYGAAYDSYVYVPGYGYVDPFSDPGTLTAFPWTKALWDSDGGEGNLRDFSEVIRIKKTVSGEYVYMMWDWGNGDNSTSWADSGIKAYIFRYDPATRKSKLVTTLTPPAGAGAFWCVATIAGNKVTETGVLTNNYLDCSGSVP